MHEYPEGLLTYEEAAHEIGLTLGSLKQVIGRGMLHPVKVPRQRRKFLRREEVMEYRDGKKMPPHLEKGSFMPRAGDSTTKPLTASMTRQEITEALHMIITEANRAWAANAEAYQASAEAYQASAVAIHDGLIRALQVYYTALTGTADWPQPSGEPNQPREPAQAGSPLQGDAGTNSVEDILHQMQAASAHPGTLTRSDQ
jgi:hypothetical protein